MLSSESQFKIAMQVAHLCAIISNYCFSSTMNNVFSASCIIRVAFFFLLFPALHAQRLQLQVHTGWNASEAFIKDQGQSKRETLTYYDTVPKSQYGIALNLRLIRSWHLRVEGNYRQYRTFFEMQQPGLGGPATLLGNLYNEKYTLSLLPEYRRVFFPDKPVQLPVYAYVGLAMSQEKGKNYQYVNIINNGLLIITDSFEADTQWGTSVGMGINPKWKRVGGLLDLRFSRMAYANEAGLVGELAYNHFTVALGLTFDLL